MKINLKMFAVLLLSSSIISCGMYEGYQVKIQDDNGLGLQSISLDKNSITLSGFAGYASDVVVASTNPSYVDDKTIYWESANEKIATVEKIDSTSAKVLMTGKGKTIIRAKNVTGKIFAECSVNCVFLVQKPFEAQNLTFTPYGNNFKISFNTPEKNAEYISYAKAKVYKGNSASGIFVKEEKFDSITQKNSLYEKRITGLEKSTEYYVELLIGDVNGNESNCIGASCSTNEGETVAPEKVTDASYVDNTSSIDVAWTDSVAEDFNCVQIKVYKENSSEYDSYEVAAGIQTCTIPNIEEGLSYTVEIIALDNNYNPSETVILNISRNESAVRNLKFINNEEALLKYSGCAKLTWTLPKKSDYAKISVTAIPSDKTVYRDETVVLSKTDTSCVFENLAANMNYSFAVKTLSDTDEVLATNVVSGYPTLITIRFWNNNETKKGFMVPIDSSTVKNLEASSENYYGRWAKHKALDGTVNFDYELDGKTGISSTYSIEALTAGTHIATGLYLSFNSVSASEATANVSLLPIDSITDKTLASFFTAASNDSTSKSVRIMYESESIKKGSAQFGAKDALDNKIICRASEGSPGYQKWWWNVTDANETKEVQ